MQVVSRREIWRCARLIRLDQNCKFVATIFWFALRCRMWEFSIARGPEPTLAMKKLRQLTVYENWYFYVQQIISVSYIYCYKVIWVFALSYFYTKSHQNWYLKWGKHANYSFDWILCHLYSHSHSNKYKALILSFISFCRCCISMFHIHPFNITPIMDGLLKSLDHIQNNK